MHKEMKNKILRSGFRFGIESRKKMKLILFTPTIESYYFVHIFIESSNVDKNFHIYPLKNEFPINHFM